jgi:uncharacterized protein
MKRIAMTLLAVAALLYAALCAGLYFGQRSMLYFPTPETLATRAEAVRLPTRGAVLKLWRLPHAGDRAVIYFGGNADDAAVFIDEFAAILPDRAVYIVNYRGYGGSTGRPSEAGLLADAEDVFDFVRAAHPRVSVIGRSLGSGVAVHLATVREVDKLVLVTPYDSIERVAQRHFSLFPVAWLLADKFDSFSKARAVRAPVLVLSAELDRLIPSAHTERLIEALPRERVRAQTVAGANHDSIATDPEYRAALREFLRD